MALFYLVRRGPLPLKGLQQHGALGHARARIPLAMSFCVRGLLVLRASSSPGMNVSDSFRARSASYLPPMAEVRMGHLTADFRFDSRCTRAIKRRCHLRSPSRFDLIVTASLVCKSRSRKSTGATQESGNLTQPMPRKKQDPPPVGGSLDPDPARWTWARP